MAFSRKYFAPEKESNRIVEAVYVLREKPALPCSNNSSFLNQTV